MRIIQATFCIMLLSPILHAKIQHLKSVKANSCITVKMVKEQKKAESNWFIFAENKCFEPMTIGKQLKITKAKNVTAHENHILDIREFIVPEKSKHSKHNKKKLIFNASKKSPGSPAELQWILF